jgi:hypothetical protein
MCVCPVCNEIYTTSSDSHKSQIILSRYGHSRCEGCLEKNGTISGYCPIGRTSFYRNHKLDWMYNRNYSLIEMMSNPPEDFLLKHMKNEIKVKLAIFKKEMELQIREEL